MRTRHAIRAGLLASFLAVASPLAAAGVTITDYPTTLGAPWGIGFSPFYNGYMVGGSQAWAFEEDLEGVSHGTVATDLRDLAVSPDGTAWIVEPTANKIWRYSANGTVTPFSVPGAPTGIALGPDGNMWFTENTGNKIGRITPGGGVWESPAIPTGSSHPEGIALGPDGNLWFVETTGNNYARITPEGTITEYPLKTAGASPEGIAISAYGVVAITEPGINKIAFANIGDTATLPAELSIPTSSSSPRGIVFGPDGGFWFVEYQTSRIGRAWNQNIPIQELTIPTAGSHPRQIVVGSRNDLWFTESTGRLGHILLHPPGDPNGDGHVDVADVFYVINYLFAGGAAPK